MNNMERGRVQKEPDNQSSGKATAKIDRKTAAGASTFLWGNEDPFDSDSDSAYHFSYFVHDFTDNFDQMQTFTFGQDPESTQSVYAFDTTDEESDTEESKDKYDQDKELFEDRLNPLIEVDNAAEDTYIASLQATADVHMDRRGVHSRL